MQFSIWEQRLSRNLERFRGGLVVKAHRLLYHSTLGSRVITKKESDFIECRRTLTPISIKNNLLLKLILLEQTPLLTCCGFVTRQKWLVLRRTKLRKALFLIDVGVKTRCSRRPDRAQKDGSAGQDRARNDGSAGQDRARNDGSTGPDRARNDGSTRLEMTGLRDSK